MGYRDRTVNPQAEIVANVLAGSPLAGDPELYELIAAEAADSGKCPAAYAREVMAGLAAASQQRRAFGLGDWFQ